MLYLCYTSLMSKTGETLNPQQLKAVKIKNGPSLVVAGAGTGKTRVIVERIVQLIKGGVEPKSIVALTFTEKAANEMLDRINEARGGYNFDTAIQTFNAFGQDMLNEHAFEIGLGGGIRLVGEVGKQVILHEHLDELGLDYFSPISNPRGQLNVLADYFSLLKQQIVKPQVYAEFALKLPASTEEEAADKQRHTELARAYKSYLDICRHLGVVDYDDQIFLLIELLEIRPNVRKKLSGRFKFILVDEFQDTNPMQSRLLELMASEHQNLMVVGDDDQSIYGWRGATLANILGFSQKYPKAKLVTLIQNYRSTQPILDAAYRLIQNNNPDRLEAMESLDKRLMSRSKVQTQPSVNAFDELDHELAWIADDVRTRLDKGQDPGSIAVLTRSNPMAKKVHQALEFAGVQHILAGDKSDIYQHPSVAAMIEALKTVVDPADNQALYHTLGGVLFKLDTPKLAAYSAHASRAHKKLEDVIKDDEEPDEDFTSALKTIDSWRKQTHGTGVAHLSFTILDESGLRDEYMTKAEDSAEDALRAQAVGQWLNSLLEFQKFSDLPSARSYLDNLPTLKAEGETLEDDSLAISDSLVNVMTIHKAKGLEWKTVYIADCTEMSLPSKKRSAPLEVPDSLMIHSKADEHLAEERRLMYVAATRAKIDLILTHSHTHTGKTKKKPSRFITEMFGDDFFSSHQPRSGQSTLELFDPASRPLSAPALPSRMRQGDNLVLTVSQAGDYLRCPLDFKYRYILSVPGPPKATPVIGTLLHAALQQINEALIAGRGLPKLEDLMSQLKANWPQEGHESPKQSLRAEKLALKSLRRFYEQAPAGPVPIASEKRFKFKVPGAPLILTGRIDAVFDSKMGVEVRDYKSSTNATSAEKAKKQAQGSKQLTMYAMAWQEIAGELPAKLSLDFIQTGFVGEVSKKPSSLETLAKNLKEAVENIRAGKFKPGYKHDYCRHPQLD